MKTYESHEYEYQRMQTKGIKSWDLRSYAWEIDPNDQRFLEDVFAQPWTPQNGKVLELGCGTGPLLRMLAQRGFGGVGIDISKTAIQMAKEQSEGNNITYHVGDICAIPKEMRGKFDFIIDGHAAHCITQLEDRVALFEGIYTALKPDGVFVLMTMCAPVQRKLFSQLYEGDCVVDGSIYTPVNSTDGWSDARMIKGNPYIPTRRLEHWKSILKQLQQMGFTPQLLRVNRYNEQEAVSYLNAAFTLK
ncbi:TPA: hypothetical protein DDW35_08750 [Candidatus Sumerlaeota bacterium]|jgi:SAM-dependent methyltransferase|nr:hypothetical protein [Candidatus Sumerlaeota bacterium]